MWINPMLTIWLYGTLFSIVLIAVSLAVWYRPERPDGAGGPGRSGGADDERGER